MTDTFIQISQSHLKVLSTCGRKFQHTYLDQLGFISAAPSGDQQQGQLFHQLMQQYWMGLDINPLLETSAKMRSRFESFQAHPPRLIEGEQLTEHRRMSRFGKFLLVGVFDLLILGQNQAQIIDWKSYQKPRSPQHLKNNWQTRLYPYILSQSSPYQPQQISMTYWFAQSKQNPLNQNSHTYHFPYDGQQHHETEVKLSCQLSQLQNWLENFQQGQAFPQVEHQNICQNETETCVFLERCQRNLPAPQQSLTNIDAIPELSP